MDAVEPEEVGEVIGWQKIVHGNDLDVVPIYGSAQNSPSDTPEAVDPEPQRYRHVSSFRPSKATFDFALIFLLDRIKIVFNDFLASQYKMLEKPNRGRPRAYDPERALHAALHEFWKRGYGATSLDHLSQATGMARPSLYSAFGNKLAIYRKAVRLYADRAGEQRRAALFDEPSLQKALDSYFAALTDAYVSASGEPLGCPIISVISGEAASDAEIGTDLVAGVEKIDAQFRCRIEATVKAGELPADADVAGIAATLSALQHSLALRARAGVGKPNLLAIARTHIALVLNGAGWIAADR